MKQARQLRTGYCLLSVWLGLATAAAHAPPLGAKVLSAPSGEQVIVTNRGLVLRDPKVAGDSLLCNEALGIGTTELPHVTLLGGGSLLVASSSGLRLSHDRGCSWLDLGQSAMGATRVPALARDPNDPQTVFVAADDGDVPGLYRTRDGGENWSLVFATEEGDYVHSLLPSQADSMRIYAVLRTFGPGVKPKHALLRTLDGGTEWQRVSLPLNEDDYLAVAAASDPANAETLILYSVANSPGLVDSRLLVSRDGGDSFDVPLVQGEIRGASYDSSGRLWVAAREGLYVSNANLTLFEQRSLANELGCVSENAAGLLVCGHYQGSSSGQFGVGISSDGGESFTSLLDFSNVRMPVTCPEDSPTRAICAEPWADWEREILVGTSPPESPAGDKPLVSPAPEPSAVAAVAPPAGEEAGCSLSSNVPGRLPMLPWVLCLATLAVSASARSGFRRQRKAL